MTPPPFLDTRPPPVPVPSQERLEALYAFTSAQRQSNPTGYGSNVAWWTGVLEATLRSGWVGGTITAKDITGTNGLKVDSDEESGAGNVLVLKVDDTLLGRYQTASGSRPRGLGGVVETLVTSNPWILFPLSLYTSSPTPLRAPPSLASRFVARPLWWALGKVSPFGNGGEATVVREEVLWKKYGAGAEYVHIPLLEQSAALFTVYMASHPALSYSETLYSRAGFHKFFATRAYPRTRNGPAPTGARLSKRDTDTLLQWLSRDCGVIVLDGDIVKVLDEGERALDHPITEADRGAVSVLDTLVRIDEQISSIEAESAKCQANAKRQLSLGQRGAAASYLRSKKQLDDVLAKRVAAGEQLRSVVRALDQARGDVEIMRAYELSTATLATALSDPNLSPDHISKTTDALADVLADQREIDEAVRMGGALATAAAGIDIIDDDELQLELEGLVLEDKKEKEEIAQRAATARRVAEEKANEEKKAKEAEIKHDEITKAEAKALHDKLELKAPSPPAVTAASDAELASWNDRHEAAQAREREERTRAEAERLKREDRVAAE